MFKALSEKERLLRVNPIRNNCPAKFTDIHTGRKADGDQNNKAASEAVRISFVSKEDCILNEARLALVSAINCAFLAAEIYILPTTCRIFY